MGRALPQRAIGFQACFFVGVDPPQVFDTQRGRGENYDVLHNFLQEWLSDRSCLETYHEMQRHRICAAPVLDPEQMANSPHLRDRDFLGFSEAVTEARGELLGRDLPSRSEFSFSTSLMSKSARRPSSDAFLDLKNQSKLNLRGIQPMSRVDGEA